MCLGAAQTSGRGSSPERRIGLRRSRTDRNSGATTSTVIKRSDCQTIAKCYPKYWVPRDRSAAGAPKEHEDGRDHRTWLHPLPGVTVPDERLPETLGRHPVVRDYAETHIFMSAKCFVSYPA